MDTNLALGFFFGLFTSIVGVVLAHYLQYLKFRKERLLDKYVEFIGVASQEKNRAKAVVRLLNALTSSLHSRNAPPMEQGDTQFPVPAWIAERLAKLDEDRFALWADLEKLELQILLWETNPQLKDKLREVVSVQLYTPLVPPTISIHVMEQFQNHQQEIIAFEGLVRSLSELIQRIHKDPFVGQRGAE